MIKNTQAQPEKTFNFIDFTKHTFFIFCFNIPIWIFIYLTNWSKPLFEYSTIFSLLIFSRFRYFGMFILIFIFIFILFYDQSHTYHFNVFDFFQSIRYISNINLKYIFNNFLLYFFIFYNLYMIYTCLYFYKKVQSRHSLGYFSIFLLLVMSFDNLNGSLFFVSGSDKMKIPVNFIGSTELSALNSVINHSKDKKIRLLKNNQSIIFKYKFIDWAVMNKDRSIVFIVAESFGLPKSSKSVSWLKQKLDIKNYKAIYNEIEFKGSTTDGELRSLCALQGSYASINRPMSDYCLTTELVKIGWSASGFHGFSGRLFDRYLWWPKIGLQSASFGDSSTVKEMPRCGNIFRGACDEDMVQLAFRKAYRPKSFIYLLTLSTHLPVVTAPIPSDLAEICALDNVPIEACMHIASLGRLLSNVAKEASMQPKGPLIVVVGDHAPPFINKQNRDVFMQDKVPSFVLIPK